MRVSAWWAGAAIPNALEIIDALFGPVGDGFSRGDSLRHFCDRSRQIVEHPMNPRAHRSIGVVADEREAFCGLRDVAPIEWRRDVFSVAGVLSWDRLPFGKGGTDHSNGHNCLLLLRCASVVNVGTKIGRAHV